MSVLLCSLLIYVCFVGVSFRLATRNINWLALCQVFGLSKAATLLLEYLWRSFTILLRRTPDIVILGPGKTGTTTLMNDLCSLKGFQSHPFKESDYVWLSRRPAAALMAIDLILFNYIYRIFGSLSWSSTKSVDSAPLVLLNDATFFYDWYSSKIDKPILYIGRRNTRDIIRSYVTMQLMQFGYGCYGNYGRAIEIYYLLSEEARASAIANWRNKILPNDAYRFPNSFEISIPNLTMQLKECPNSRICVHDFEAYMRNIKESNCHASVTDLRSLKKTAGFKEPITNQRFHLNDSERKAIDAIVEDIFRESPQRRSSPGGLN